MDETEYRPDIKKIAPKKVYESNLSMSAAFAGFWARHYAEMDIGFDLSQEYAAALTLHNQEKTH